MRFQERGGWCGPAALQNALRCFGKKVSQTRIARLSGASAKNGTGTQGIIDAARALGFTAEVMATGDEWGLELRSRLVTGCIPIICVDGWSHWVAVIGVRYSADSVYFVVIDSDRTKANKSENGVVVVDSKQLNVWWRGPDDRYPKYCGVAIGNVR